MRVTTPIDSGSRVPEQHPIEVPTQEVEEAQPTTELAPVGPALIAQTEDEAWVERTLTGLTLRQKVGQLIMPWVLGDFAPEGSPSHDRILEYIEDQGIGGVIMSVGSPTKLRLNSTIFRRTPTFHFWWQRTWRLELGSECEEPSRCLGLLNWGSYRFFPLLMAVGATADPQLAYEMGRITAREARGVGIHIPFAPVLDVNNNPDNPIINVRSFGENPEDVRTWALRSCAVSKSTERLQQENISQGTGTPKQIHIWGYLSFLIRVLVWIA
ncbi:MAG: hypothetical protein CM1200mP14_23370 [Gammaproteobacteria bacterium]|nr:MAG: hypothetical protein CM1200mP14_23370 [Gammaproteobacteria bacterium]